MLPFLQSYPSYLKIHQMQALIKWHFKSKNIFAVYKDHNVIIQQANEMITLGCGFRNVDDINGKMDHELSHPSATLADSFVIQDKKTLSGKKLFIFEITHYKREAIPVMVIRVPVIDESFKIVGSVAFSERIINSSLLKNFNKLIDMRKNRHGVTLILHEENILLNEFTENNELSKKELEILWLLARGLSPKKIARFLQRSPRTIESHIEHIKIKYACPYKPDLIEKAIDNHILNYLPIGLALNNGECSHNCVTYKSQLNF